jgi:hypothetical protein
MKKLPLGLGAFLVLVLWLAVLGCGPNVPVITVAQIPWPDSETTYYVIQNSQGTAMGTLNTTIVRDGDKYLMLSTVVMGNTTDEAVMALNSVDLKPISEIRTIDVPAGGAIPGGIYQIMVDYHDSQITFEAYLPGDQHQGPYEFKIPADSYANDEVWYLFRALPFEEGYSGRYTNVIIWTTFQTPSTTVTVVGSETVSAPAGNFDCYKLEVTVANTSVYVWYAKAAPHYMVKYQKGDSLILLTDSPQ